MSTTSSLEVAVEYSLSRESLIFKIKTSNNLQRGAGEMEQCVYVVCKRVGGGGGTKSPV